MKKPNKQRHVRKMQKLRRKMLKAWANNKRKKAQKTRNKIIQETLLYNQAKNNDNS